MNDTGWSYLSGSKERCGPVSSDDLLGLLDAGTITEQTFVWRPGMTAWKKACDVPELQVSKTAPADSSDGGQTANLLTQRANASAQQQESARKSGAVGPGDSGGFLKVAAAVLLIAVALWANNVFYILPGANGIVETDQPDRWFSADNREGAIMQCTIDRKGRGRVGGVRYRLAATVSAGVARGRRLPVDTAGYSQVVIRDSSGNIVFNQPVSNAKLCPS